MRAVNSANSTHYSTPEQETDYTLRRRLAAGMNASLNIRILQKEESIGTSTFPSSGGGFPQEFSQRKMVNIYPKILFIVAHRARFASISQPRGKRARFNLILLHRTPQ